MVDFKALERHVRDRSASIGVIGLGYVGLPLAIALADAGFPTTGLDIDPERVAALAAGRSPIRHIPDHRLRQALDQSFQVTSDFATLARLDAILICVPTPLDKHREPDLRFVVTTAETIAKYLRAGQLVVLESTTYPGTTRDVLLPILESSGLKSGTDFFLAYSPEREDPANQEFGTAAIPRIVGADGDAALTLAHTLYAQIIEKVVPVASLETAEAAKLTENIFRAVNIALVNELKIVFSAMGIDVWDVIEAAKTKPFGFMPFYPGPGLGGHCIPIDPFYLTWKAREYDIATRFIELAGEINTAMPRYVVGRLATELDTRFRMGLNGTRVLVVGIAYKKNVDDMRESPSLTLIRLLEARGAEVAYHDPFIPAIPMSRNHADLANRRSIPWSAETLRHYAAALIVTDHDGVDYQGLVQSVPLVLDCRNACTRHGVFAPNIAKS